jgi:hypothetical protein
VLLLQRQTTGERLERKRKERNRAVREAEMRRSLAFTLGNYYSLHSLLLCGWLVRNKGNGVSTLVFKLLYLKYQFQLTKV